MTHAPPDGTAPILPGGEVVTRKRRPGLRRRGRGQRLPWFSGTILAVFVLCGLLGQWIAPADPDAVNLNAALVPPVFQGGGSWDHVLGTDQLGRDVLSRLLAGAQVSFLVSLAVVVGAGVIGVIVAVLAGFVGGRLDAFLTRTTDATMAFPFLLLAIVIVGIFGASLRNVIIVLVFAGWPQYARVLRSEVLRIRGQDYVQMVRVMGGKTFWSIRTHVIPNLVATLVVLATLQLGTAVVAEGSLSFLGIGVPPPAASWGNMLADGRKFVTSAWWLPTLPGICLSLVVLGANLMGDWIRDHYDPTTRR